MNGISYSITLYTPVSAVFNNLKNWATARLWATAKFAVDHNDREGCLLRSGSTPVVMTLEEIRR